MLALRTIMLCVERFLEIGVTVVCGELFVFLVRPDWIGSREWKTQVVTAGSDERRQGT